MGFDIVSGGGGIISGIALVVAIPVLAIIAYVFFTAAKKARDEVVEETDHDIEA